MQNVDWGLVQFLGVVWVGMNVLTCAFFWAVASASKQQLFSLANWSRLIRRAIVIGRRKGYRSWLQRFSLRCFYCPIATMGEKCGAALSVALFTTVALPIMGTNLVAQQLGYEPVF